MAVTRLLPSFNSTLVQLKDGDVRNHPHRSGLFQFYLSSIKSVAHSRRTISEYVFQFYLSSIKSMGYTPRFIDLKTFQFYLSSIKSLTRIYLSLTLSRFNSTLVQLKDYVFIFVLK